MPLVTWCANGNVFSLLATAGEVHCTQRCTPYVHFVCAIFMQQN